MFQSDWACVRACVCVCVCSSQAATTRWQKCAVKAPFQQDIGRPPTHPTMNSLPWKMGTAGLKAELGNKLTLRSDTGDPWSAVIIFRFQDQVNVFHLICCLLGPTLFVKTPPREPCPQGLVEAHTEVAGHWPGERLCTFTFWVLISRCRVRKKTNSFDCLDLDLQHQGLIVLHLPTQFFGSRSAFHWFLINWMDDKKSEM